MTTWHAGRERIAAYVDGGLDALEAASVEQHLTRCGPCRLEVRDVTDTTALDERWVAIRDAVVQPRRPASVRLARRLGLPDPIAVVLAATAALRTAWLVGALAALGFAFLAAWLSEGSTLWPFLLIAPLVPVLGVAVAYDPADEPLEVLATVTPVGRTRLVMVRTVAVLVSCLPVALVVGLAIPGPTWVAIAWLTPALSLVVIQLALAGFVGPRPASAVVTLGWGAMVLGTLRHWGPTWAVEPERQAALLVAAVLAAVVIVARRLARGTGEVL